MAGFNRNHRPEWIGIGGRNHRNTHQVHKPLEKADVGDIGAPDLIGMVHLKAREQVRVLSALLAAFAQVALRTHSLDSHLAHQALNTLMVDRMALSTQPSRHPGRSIKGKARVLLIDEAHQLQVKRALQRRTVIVAGARYPQQLTLPHDTQPRVVRLDDLASIVNGALQIFFFNHSLSTSSCPIFW